MSSAKDSASVFEGLFSDEPHKVADIVVVNDIPAIYSDVKDFVKKMQDQGHDVALETTVDGSTLSRLLQQLSDDDVVPPTLFMLDVVGVGEDAANMIFEWYREYKPDYPLPQVHFFSSVGEASLDMAVFYKNKYPDTNVEFIYPEEAKWVADFLAGHLDSAPPPSLALRAYLNEQFDLNAPLSVDDKYAGRQKRLEEVSGAGLIDAWSEGKVDSVRAIEGLRGYVMGIANALRQGLYMIEPKGDHDALFFQSASHPVKGPTAFSIVEYEALKAEGERPILVMQSYTPELMQIARDPQLGGMVLLSPYMASHIQFICDSNNVPGLFGMIAGEGEDIDEWKEPDGSEWVEGKEIVIGDQVITAGQEILLDTKNKGLIACPEHIARIEKETGFKAPESAAVQKQTRDLDRINALFREYFGKAGITAPRVKANVDRSYNNNFDRSIGIGLARSEQMVMGDAAQSNLVKAAIAGDDNKVTLEKLNDAMQDDYAMLVARCSDNNAPVRIRLLDWSLEELLTAEEQKAFVQKYGSLDVSASDALTRWPALYEAQIDAIVKAVKDIAPEQDRLVEVMMPSVETETDVLCVKDMLDKAMERHGLAPEKIRYGTMIETLAACENIDSIAPHCAFGSFGTNDLTQEKFGIKRGDAPAHAAYKAKHGINPFEEMDESILSLVVKTTERAKAVNPSIQMDSCGAQGAKMATAFKLSAAGIDNISVAPVPANLSALPALLNYHAYDANQ